MKQSQNHQIPPPQLLQVPISMHAENRSKFVSTLTRALGDRVKNSIFFIKGSPTIPVDDQDINYYPMQESNFWYLFGVEESDCLAAIDLETGKNTLFVPQHPQSYKLWMVVKDKEDYIKQYKVDEVLYVDNIAQYLESKKPSTVFVYYGTNSDSGLQPALPDFPQLSFELNVDKETVYDLLDECRVIKSEEEIKVMKYIAQVSSDAHIEVMKKIKAGNREFQIEALFKYQCQTTCGSRFVGYDCICAEGRNSAVLHYVVNTELLREDSFVLCDMGSKYYGYVADITVTFPVSGTFNDRQKVVYNAVLDAQRVVFNMVKPGVAWPDCHLAAEKTIVTHLHQAGIIVGDLQEAITSRIGAIFFPHGLGHLLGLNVHDVGGYPKNGPVRSKEPGLKSLRTARVLQKGMTLTNEPGCYFVEFAFEEAFKVPEKAKFLNQELIKQFLDVGGVRLEDDFVVTETGYELLSHVPRSIAQVEACIRGEDWTTVQ